ncbi:MAG: hypothetical protein HOO88_00130 [Kiritimatiellaceae bacterium]|nr:hypothetical protein [Kiritimatiellaceae bacterium]
MKKSINILILLAVAAFSLWCTGDLMRKNDQATILAGAYDLAHGRMQDSSAYYQYDKTYVLYWTCAAILKIFPDTVSPIVITNISLAILFWSALAAFVVRFRRTLEPLVLLCFLTAPAVLLNTLYVNSSVLSSAFLLLSAAFLLQEKQRGSWLAGIFFFLAVGSRADAILLLPLLLWLITPFPVAGKSLADFSRHLKLCAAGVLALGAGRILCPEAGASIDPIFNLKMVAGYAVFGFGAAGLLFALYSFRLIAPSAEKRGLEKLYGLAGLAAFLLPVLFFIPQLHAPRYFWRGCEAVLLLAVSGRFPAWNNRMLKTCFVLIALLPMFLGVRLPALTRPQLTVTQPTLFPSGDGFYPMGGTVPFLLKLRHAVEQPVDHNQMVWSAVHSAQFDFSPEKTIDVLYTPMYGYFMLEASLRGGFARCLPYEQLHDRPFYADSRSLMRADPKTPLNAQQQVLTLPALFVSPVSGGIGVLRFGVGDDQWGNQTRLLTRLFAGNEYRILNAGILPDETKQTVCFSALPFANSERDAATGLYYSSDSKSSVSDGIHCAEAALPRWMSLRAFGSGQ